MKVTERKTESCLGGSGMNEIPMVRVIELPDGEVLAEGQTKAPKDAEVHDWKPEEAK
jgi:hypothetical protein